MSKALVVPDPRVQPVPRGWFEDTVLPVVQATDDFAQLDEYEASLRAVVSFVEAWDGDCVEFEKALRIVEMRRGELRPGEQGKRTDLTSGHACPEVDAVSEKTLSRWRLLARHWNELWPIIVRATDRKEVTQSALLKRIKRSKVANPSGVYTATAADLEALRRRGFHAGTVYADPPWLYDNQGTRAATSDHYSGMTVDEIAALPVLDLTASDAHLHLWTTNAFLFDARRIIEAWGFAYKSAYVWVKPQIGIGNYWRVSHEYLLLGVRGSCRFPDKNLRSWGEFPRTRHSSKPPQVRALIERASPSPRLELFGREAVEGWVVWGNEIERSVFTQSVEHWAA